MRKINWINESNNTTVFEMPDGWWAAWKKANTDLYDIDDNEFSKSVKVSQGGKEIFVYDKEDKRLYTSVMKYGDLIKID